MDFNEILHDGRTWADSELSHTFRNVFVKVVPRSDVKTVKLPYLNNQRK